jgi:cell division protein FtsQ
MAGIAPNTRAELSQRRKQLRRQRRMKQLRAVVQFIVVAGFAAVALWALRQPVWVIRDASQLRIEGNQYLSIQTIRQLVPIKYPQSIFRTQPYAIATALKSKAPFSDVQVDRQLFPPELVVRVRERTPVAVIHSKNQADGKLPSAKPDLLLDAQGNVMPLADYQSLEPEIPLPKLRVLGDPKEYRQQWSRVYQQMQQSPVPIQQVDWRQPSNLILTTDFGAIHLGPYNDLIFKRQLLALSGLKGLTKSIPPNQIDYIDLQNPDAPALQKKASQRDSG